MWPSPSIFCFTFSLFLCLEMLSPLGDSIWSGTTHKTLFHSYAIFSGSLWKGICGKWARWEQGGARAQWGAEEWMLMRPSLLIMLLRPFPFLLTTSSEDWWEEEGIRVPLGGQGGSWHLSQLCPQASLGCHPAQGACWPLCLLASPLSRIGGGGTWGKRR